MFFLPSMFCFDSASAGAPRAEDGANRSNNRQAPRGACPRRFLTAFHRRPLSSRLPLPSTSPFTHQILLMSPGRMPSRSASGQRPLLCFTNHVYFERPQGAKLTSNGVQLGHFSFYSRDRSVVSTVALWLAPFHAGRTQGPIKFRAN